jgi:L-cysteine/cystine lyase
VAPPFPPDDARLAALRAELPALGAGIHLNAAVAGPLPAVAAATMADLAGWELRIGRSTPDFREAMAERLDEARAAVAAVLTADVDEVAITASGSQALATAVWTVPWRSGDLAVTTAEEHAGLLGPLSALRERLGVELAFVDVAGHDDAAILATFDRAIRDGTRVVAMSHVTWSTGRLLPVDTVAAIAHERGATVIVDGARAVGAIRTDVPALGADLYAVAGQTWLLGPEGIGALWVGRAALEGALLSDPGAASFSRLDRHGLGEVWPDARRFDAPDLHQPAVVGFARSVGWLTMHVGLPWALTRGPAMAEAMADRLAAIPGVELLTPRDRMATIVTFRVTGWAADRTLAELGARCFAIARADPELDAVGLSVGWYSSAAELDQVAATVDLLASHRPESIPPRRALEVVGGG